MNKFKYVNPSSTGDAIIKKVLSRNSDYLGGGTNIVDLMKNNIVTPSSLIDVAQLPFNEISPYDGGIRIGATQSNSKTANHTLIRKHYPLLTKAILSGATTQIRNMATNGGNLLQKTRCAYYTDLSMPCNKRVPGSGCSALHGHNREHAIFGASENCVCTHPSDMCVALMALDAKVQIRSTPKILRTVDIDDFLRLPGDTPHIDSNIKRNEIIEAIVLPKSEFSKNYYYLKVRDRASYAFALVSAAVGLKLQGNKIQKVAIALGGVAHKPWRAHEAERWLTGKTLSIDNFQKAAKIELESAQPLEHNAFKVELTEKTIVRALKQASGENI